MFLLCAKVLMQVAQDHVMCVKYMYMHAHEVCSRINAGEVLPVDFYITTHELGVV